VSIINALSTTTTGLTVTLSVDAVDKAFEYEYDDGEGNIILDSGYNSYEWYELTQTKTNWNIVLA
jgi:hypothetical protein